MTQHTPEFLRQRSSNLSLRMAAHANSATAPTPAAAQTTSTRREPEAAKLLDPAAYTKPFCDFLQENPTVFHVVDHFKSRATKLGYTEVRQRRDTLPPSPQH
jgi:aminopeptidase I